MASAFGSAIGPRAGLPTNAVSVASFDRYEEAQRSVDRLSDAGFPVEHTAIVGSDLRLVEDVTGRLTVARALVAGAASGAWFGLLIGLIFGLFSEDAGEFFGLVLGGILLGAVFGAVFGATAHAATGGRRDFASMQRLVAGHYDVLVEESQAARAADLLRGAP
jgi:uncharacterized membrane protein